MLGWLTPDATQLSETQEARIIRVPGSLWYLVSGALGEMSDVNRWEEFGSATPQEAAEYFAQVYEDFLMSQVHYVGELRPFIFSAVPLFWLPMDGVSRVRASYPELDAVLPTNWRFGANFILPDMAGMSPVGKGTHTLFNFVLGQLGGERLHVLTVPELPSHNHSFNNWGISLTGASGTVNKPNITPTANTTGNTGSGVGHENMPPYVVVTWAVYAGR